MDIWRREKFPVLPGFEPRWSIKQPTHALVKEKAYYGLLEHMYSTREGN
jgi:hypothetical protein